MVLPTIIVGGYIGIKEERPLKGLATWSLFPPRVVLTHALYAFDDNERSI